MNQRILIRRTITAGAEPAAGSLQVGELAAGLADTPARMWIGVPTTIAASGFIELFAGAAIEDADDDQVYGRSNGDWVPVPFVDTDPPTDPPPNSLWWDAKDGALYIFYEDQWVAASPGGGSEIEDPDGDQTYGRCNGDWVPVCHVSDTPPTDPVPNAFWFNSATGALNVYYDDGDSEQWVGVGGKVGPRGPTGPAGPTGAASSIPGPTGPTGPTGGFEIPDANADNTVYGRRNNVWSAAVNRAGDTMTGPLVLPGVPTINNHAATKTYVDDVATQAARNIGRNYLHNSRFNVLQRGTGAWTANGAYTADRWRLNLSGDTASVSLVAQSDAQRQSIGDEEFIYSLSNTFTGNAAAGSFNLICQPIENVRRLANRRVIVSFFAYASVAGMRLGVSLDQNMGTGGSPQANVLGDGQSVTLTTGWQRFSLVFTLPRVTGTIGTNPNSNTALNFWYSAGSTYNARSGNVGVQSGMIRMWGMQLEVANPGQTTATLLEKSDHAYDIANCQRFYNTGYFTLQGYSPGTPITVGYGFALTGNMIMPPTVTILNEISAVGMGTRQVEASSQNTITAYGLSGANGGFSWIGIYGASADL